MSDTTEVREVWCRNHQGLVPIEADPTEWAAFYESRMFAQDAFPSMSPGDRELLISGTCGPCFEAMFPPEEDDEG